MYVSHGGLLAPFRGDQRHLKLKVDAEGTRRAVGALAFV